MSNKNILQEYCQQTKIPLPRYESTNTSTKELIEWTTSVTFGNKIYSASARSKINAEQTVAGMIIKDIKSITQNIIDTPISYAKKQKASDIYSIDLKQYETIILVDSENSELTDQQIDKYSDSLFLFFCAKNTTKLYCFTMQETKENAYVFISQSVGRDAADHLLSFTLGILTCIDKCNKYEHSYFVYTKDHYGECLEKFGLSIKHICDFNEI